MDETEVDRMEISYRDAYQFGLLPLVIWFEASNQHDEAMLAVGWVVRNRVQSPRWWGWDYPSVILKHYKGVYQFSSFDEDDPNSSRFPKGSEPAWEKCIMAAAKAFTGGAPDPTGGATHYFDRSLDASPPSWATDGTMVKTADIGDFHFYRVA